MAKKKPGVTRRNLHALNAALRQAGPHKNKQRTAKRVPRKRKHKRKGY